MKKCNSFLIIFIELFFNAQNTHIDNAGKEEEEEKKHNLENLA